MEDLNKDFTRFILTIDDDQRASIISKQMHESAVINFMIMHLSEDQKLAIMKEYSYVTSETVKTNDGIIYKMDYVKSKPGSDLRSNSQIHF